VTRGCWLYHRVAQWDWAGYPPFAVSPDGESWYLDFYVMLISSVEWNCDGTAFYSAVHLHECLSDWVTL
jgi:hypothetical protein